MIAQTSSVVSASAVPMTTTTTTTTPMTGLSSPDNGVAMLCSLNNTGVKAVTEQDLGRAEFYLVHALESACEEGSISIPNLQQQGAVVAAASESNNKSLYIYQRGEYDEGMHTYSEPMLLNHVDAHGGLFEATSTVLYNLGQLYLRQEDNERACGAFLYALQMTQMSKKDGNCGALSVIAILHNIGHVKYRLGHFEDAIKSYKLALQIAKKNSHSSHGMLEVSTTLNCLGVLHFHLQQQESNEAMSFFTESLAIRRAVLGGDSQTKEIATTLNNIGRLHYLNNHHDDALTLYREALTMRRNLFVEHHLDIAATINNVAQTHHQRGEHAQALELYNEFMVTARLTLGESHRDVAIVYKCMAQIYHERKQHDKAIELYKQALKTGKQALGIHQEVASTLNSLGNLHYETGDYETALSVYEEGLAIERAVFDSCHPNIIVTLTNIGRIYLHRAEYKPALKLYKEVFTLQRRTLGTAHASVADTLSSIGLIYYQSRKYGKALDLYQEVLRVRRDAADANDNTLDIASSLNSIGLTLYKIGEYDWAMHSFCQCLKIRKMLLGSEHNDVAVVLFNIATMHLETGDDDEALRYYAEALRVERAALGHRHHNVAMTTLHIGRVHQQRGEFEQAVKCFVEALDIQTAAASASNAKSGSNNQHFDVIALTLNHIGNVHLQSGNVAGMVDAFSDALRCLRKIGKKENDLAISGFNFYALSKMHPECAAVA